MLTLSDRLYRLLLRLYPPSFRRRFGTEMALVFQDRCRQEQRLVGRRGLLALIDANFGRYRHDRAT